MNLGDLMEKVFIETGSPDPSSDRPDYVWQRNKDAINTAMDELAATCAPSLQFLTRETTITVLAGQSDYPINDWCQRPLSMWVEGPFATQIEFRKALSADRDGSRNSLLVPLQFGPYQVALLPRTTIPALSNVPGATTGAAATEGTPTVVIGSANAVLTADAVGRMICLNGDAEDYRITAQASRTITVDRAIRSRISGLGVSHVGAGYANTATCWEIGPSGRFMLRFLPAPNAPFTAFVRYMAYPRRMVNLTEKPELQSDMHHLLWKGALRAIGATKQNDAMYQMYTKEFADALANLKASDIDDYSSPDTARVVRLGDERMRARVPGLYSRNGGGWYGGNY